ncbi:MAG: tRNA pseudouridine(55) synthase TruB [Microcoleaceae cyanobacterium]
MLGFLNLNKSAGFTSHDCVARVRRLLRLKRVGHAGTLDPAATGVLPIAIGKATRLIQFLPPQKAYHATIQFGMTTTTDDLEGETLTSQSVSDLSLEDVKSILPDFMGKIKQIPPRYSAIQVDGKRLYDLARKGEEIEVPVRTVEVFNIEILAWHPGEFPQLEVAIDCGSGTYIRSIARDWGEQLKIGGTLAQLVRTKSSGFDLTNSLTLEELETQVQQQTFQPLDPAVGLKHLAKINLLSEEAKRWCQGQVIDISTEITAQNPIRVYQQNERFLGIGKIVNSESGLGLAPQVVIHNQ